MTYPERRMRRLRSNAIWRRMVRETNLTVSDLVYPLFVVPGKDTNNPVPSMPGVSQLSVDRLVVEALEVSALGIPAVILFGVPSKKDARGSEGYDPDGIVPTAIRRIKTAVPDLLVWADVCLCEYTDHGHCGLLTEDGDVDTEKVSADASFHDVGVKMGARVVKGSIQHDVGAQTYTFRVTDGEQSYPVVYRGLAPDTFTDEVEVVVEGRLQPDGTFRATTLLAKCGSRYEAVPEA